MNIQSEAEKIKQEGISETQKYGKTKKKEGQRRDVHIDGKTICKHVLANNDGSITRTKDTIAILIQNVIPF